jgi:cytidylate kinase
MRERGDTDSYEEVLSQVRERDEQDMNRPVEPLRQAKDAVLLDSTNLTFEQVIDRIAEMAEEVRHGN